jgi:hypothetical protein
MSSFHFPKATGEFRQCWYDEIAALHAFLLQISRARLTSILIPNHGLSNRTTSRQIKSGEVVALKLKAGDIFLTSFFRMIIYSCTEGF